MNADVNTNLTIQSPSENILELQNLKVYFALKKFGFQHAGYACCRRRGPKPKSGQTIAIVGESGSGKTSLMRTVLHLNIPTEGTVTFDGQIVNNLKSEQLKVIDTELDMSNRIHMGQCLLS